MSNQTGPFAHAGAQEALGTALSRREALGKLRYVAPAIVAIKIAHPQTVLGRSGPVRAQRPKNKSKSKTS